MVPVPYIEPACQNHTHPDADPDYRFSVEYSCAESVLDTGERVVLGETVTVWETGHRSKPLTVVLYAADGAAYVLLRLAGPADGRGQGDPDVLDPVMTLDGLTALTAALPRVPVI